MNGQVRKRIFFDDFKLTGERNEYTPKGIKTIM